MKLKKIILGIFCLAALFTVNPVNAEAAKGIEIKEDLIEVPFLGSKTIDFTYTGNFSDIAVIVSDASKVAYAITDLGNGKGSVAFSSVDIGRVTAAVYKLSDMSAFDYLYINSGLPTGDNVLTYSLAGKSMTLYNECVIRYENILHGENSASAVINSVSLKKNPGVNELEVNVTMATDDAKLAGLSTYTAEYYDVYNNLMKTSKVYVRTNLGVAHNICWYIPKDCVTIILK